MFARRIFFSPFEILPAARIRSRTTRSCIKIRTAASSKQHDRDSKETPPPPPPKGFRDRIKQAWNQAVKEARAEELERQNITTNRLKNMSNSSAMEAHSAVKLPLEEQPKNSEEPDFEVSFCGCASAQAIGYKVCVHP